jgi:hypothetical protein
LRFPESCEERFHTMTEDHLIEEEREGDSVPDPLHQPTLFEWAGGYPALLGLTRIFYS